MSICHGKFLPEIEPGGTGPETSSRNRLWNRPGDTVPATSYRLPQYKILQEILCQKQIYKKNLLPFNPPRFNQICLQRLFI